MPGLGPANDVPLFRGNASNLDDLASELKDTCETLYFGEAAIRRHSLDSLAETRGMGYDYLKVNANYHNVFHLNT